jgi:hypothetical protein
VKECSCLLNAVLCMSTVHNFLPYVVDVICLLTQKVISVKRTQCTGRNKLLLVPFKSLQWSLGSVSLRRPQSCGFWYGIRYTSHTLKCHAILMVSFMPGLLTSLGVLGRVFGVRRQRTVSETARCMELVLSSRRHVR